MPRARATAAKKAAPKRAPKKVVKAAKKAAPKKAATKKVARKPAKKAAKKAAPKKGKKWSTSKPSLIVPPDCVCVIHSTFPKVQITIASFLSLLSLPSQSFFASPPP